MMSQIRNCVIRPYVLIRPIMTETSLPKSLGIKQGQSYQSSWHYHGKISMFYVPREYFLNITRFLKETVTIQWKVFFLLAKWGIIP